MTRPRRARPDMPAELSDAALRLSRIALLCRFLKASVSARHGLYGGARCAGHSGWPDGAGRSCAMAGRSNRGQATARPFTTFASAARATFLSPRPSRLRHRN